ncbi:hypothetical protein [Massilia sp. CCM 8734]|uniref:hypothetical protein n=1 Tax=Massilia sp. CCM 8734 TaxID=2609283 RepID=UPI00141FAACA|nr:hypothetical protein [Massilia sp. CCM 8734]NHZ94197.1 hypothetical protein [Massilia sp. CCM 8734]
MMRRACALASAMLACCAASHAGQAGAPWAASLELEAGLRAPQPGARRPTRLSVDVGWEHQASADWRFKLADRFEHFGGTQRRTINTLKDAYLSWNASAESAIDLGRVNLRQGVAAGYNPSDYFRARAVRSVVSVDPETLRRSRSGTYLVQGQRVWDGGSVSAVLAPRIGGDDGGNTNARARAMLVGSVRLAPDFQPQALLLLEEGEAPQLGLNLSTLLGDALSAHAEWSGGRQRDLLSRALGWQDGRGGRAWRNRLAAGATYTAGNRMSFTAEVHWCGAALDKEQWAGLARQSAQYWAYRDFVRREQEPPTRKGLFAMLVWPDALRPRLDLSAVAKHDLQDRSSLLWSEARWRLDEVDVALQWTHVRGGAWDQFAAHGERNSWRLLAQWYL